MSTHHKKEQLKIRVIKHLSHAITAMTENRLADALFNMILATIRLRDLDDGQSADTLLSEVQKAQAEHGQSNTLQSQP